MNSKESKNSESKGIDNNSCTEFEMPIYYEDK